MPRWSDDPAHILGVLANYLKLDDPEMAPDALFDRGAREAEAMIRTLVERAERRGRLRGRLVRLALDRARKLAGLREMPKYDLVVALAAVRRELAAVGAELARRGSIETGDDVFFLDLKEARAGLDGRTSARSSASGGIPTRRSSAGGISRGSSSPTAPSPKRRRSRRRTAPHSRALRRRRAA